MRSGDRILEFPAAVIGTATSGRPGVARWTELTVYRLPSGHYVVSKVGRSTIAHRPDCWRVNPRKMRTWLEAGDEGKVRRVPCLECGPAVGDQMDPQTFLECTRYTVLQARDPESLAKTLLQGRPGDAPQPVSQLTGVTAEIIRQVRAHDSAFETWWKGFIKSSDR